MPQYLSTFDAAQLLGISPERLRCLLRQGRITGAQRIGSDARGVWAVPLGLLGKPEITKRRARGKDLKPRQGRQAIT